MLSVLPLLTGIKRVYAILGLVGKKNYYYLFKLTALGAILSLVVMPITTYYYLDKGAAYTAITLELVVAIYTFYLYGASKGKNTSSS